MSERPARLLLLTPAEATGGAEGYLVALARHLLARGHEVHAGLGRGAALDGVAADLEAAGVAVLRRDLSWHWDGRPAAERLKAQFAAVHGVMAAVAPDAAFLNLNWVDAGTAPAAAAAACGVPAVTLFHLCPHRIALSAHERRLYAFALASGQRWFAVSRDNRLFVARSTGVSEEAIGVIYNGPLVDPSIDLDDPATRLAMRGELRAELGLPEDARIMTTVGRHDLQKGLQDVLPMLPGLLAAYPDLHFLWIGDGPYRERFAQLVRRFDPDNERVTFWAKRDDVARCLGGSDLFLFPTRFEGFSLALLEAMHMGCPPVVTDVSSVREAVEDGVSGLVCGQGDLLGLRRAIGRLLDHPQERRRMGEAARRAAARFPAEEMLDHASRALLEVAAGRRRAVPDAAAAWRAAVDCMSGRTDPARTTGEFVS